MEVEGEEGARGVVVVVVIAVVVAAAASAGAGAAWGAAVGAAELRGWRDGLLLLLWGLRGGGAAVPAD